MMIRHYLWIPPECEGDCECRISSISIYNNISSVGVRVFDGELLQTVVQFSTNECGVAAKMTDDYATLHL